MSWSLRILWHGLQQLQSSECPSACPFRQRPPVEHDCPQPSHEDAPNSTAMLANCSHSWKNPGNLPVQWFGMTFDPALTWEMISWLLSVLSAASADQRRSDGRSKLRIPLYNGDRNGENSDQPSNLGLPYLKTNPNGQTFHLFPAPGQLPSFMAVPFRAGTMTHWVWNHMESMVNRLVKVKIYKIPLFLCALKRRGLNHTYIYIHIHIYIFTVCASVSISQSMTSSIDVAHYLSALQVY